MSTSTDTWHRVARVAAPAAWLAFVVGCGPDYPKCDEDDDCKEGEFCVQQQCQQCRDDDDCAQGMQCADGRCDPLEGYCEGTGDCGEGEECQNNRCTTVTQAEEDLQLPTDEGPCALQPVYFSFDSDALESSARDVLQSNAQCIRERELESVHLTGLTDPRGTEEYNLALGSRRAEATKQYLVSLGVDRENISVSSMGEEMAEGSDDASWEKDRRVVFSSQ